MVMLLVQLMQALTFSITVSQDATRTTLRYPAAEGVSWLQVCVESEGRGERDEPWYANSCWEPRFPTEEYRLAPDAYYVRAHLTIDQDGKRSTLHTPVLQVRPEPGETRRGAR